ncbi:hypothetical protein Droror1_Dr00013412 [Drosera rotundifolia]
MKFFSWVQNKLGGGEGQRINQKPNAVSVTCDHSKQDRKKDDNKNRPHELLSIGTFGNLHHLSPDPKTQITQPESPSSSPDLSDFTPEEVGQLQKELTKLLKRKTSAKQEVDDSNKDNLPLDRFLNCPSSLETSRRISGTVCSDQVVREDDLERTISVIIGKCKEVRAEKKKKEAIGKKSFSFLLKKVSAFASGFSPAPSLRDPLLESRMEKLLRTIVQKKMYQQNSSHSSTMKRYIVDSKHTSKDNDEVAKKKPRSGNGSKWVKTDAEYIVLEI